jgi:MurNAc alpha-1-phosphate uridylyltransferase
LPGLGARSNGRAGGAGAARCGGGRRGGGDFSLDAAGRIGWDKGPSGRVYVGAQILKTDRIAAHPEAAFSMVEVWNAMMEGGRLIGHAHDGRWADVGHPEGIAEAEAMVGHDAAV